MWLVGLLMLLAIMAAILFVQTGKDREVRDMSQPERAALYHRALETLRASCAHGRGPVLADYCEEQANFVRHFPECDQECRTLCARAVPLPAR